MSTIPYSVINRPHSALDLDQVFERNILYRGVDVQEHAHRFLKVEPNEQASRYENRCATVAYENHMGPLINKFTAALFKKDILVAPIADNSGVDITFYEQFATNANLGGSANAKTLSMLGHQVLTDALLHSRGYVGVDFPKRDESITTLVEEEQAGTARAYAFNLPVECVINWQEDKRSGDFTWVVIKSVNDYQSSPFMEKPTYTVEFKLWKRDPGTNEVTWALWSTDPIELGKEPKATDPVHLVDQGPSSFKQIPVLKLALPPSLCVGDKVAPLQVEHYMLKSNLFAAEKRNLFPVGVMKLGPEIGAQGGALPSEIQSDPDRGYNAVNNLVQGMSTADIEIAARLRRHHTTRPVSCDFTQKVGMYQAQGWAVMGSEDSLEFPEPAGTSYSLVYQQLQDKVTTIYQLADQMQQSLPAVESGMARSAMSKQEDRNASVTVLGALDKFVKKFVDALYTCIAQARNEMGVTWQVEGLNVEPGNTDKASVLDVLERLGLTDFKSDTFKKLILQQCAKQLLDDATVEQIQEIESEIDSASFHEPALTKPTVPPTPSDS